MRYLRNQICQAAILANHNGVAAKIITSLLPSAPPPESVVRCEIEKLCVQEESEVQRELWFFSLLHYQCKTCHKKINGTV